MTKRSIYSLVIFNHFWAIFGLFYFDYSYYWLLVSVLGWILFGKIGGEAGFHRYFTHKSYHLKKIKETVILYLGCMNCFGSPISWAVIHSAHHNHSDTDLDPHGAIPLWKVWLTHWKQPPQSRKTVVSFSKNKKALWLHRNYFKVIFVSFLLVSVIDLRLSVFLISIPALVTFHSAGLVNTICHRFGYRNFETKDRSYNNLLVNFLTLGSGLHNNHHQYPRSWNNSHKWYEIDAVSWAIFLIKDSRAQDNS